MKIAILGTSGSGKSTLAKRLGERYGLPVLHMDTVHFLPGWVERPFAEEEAIVRQFLDENAGGWVIDGNYSKTCYARRLKEADKIIVLWFSPLVCLWRAIRRWQQNKGRVRESSAPGCEEKIDAEFVRWILHDGRTKQKGAKMGKIGEKNPEKYAHACDGKRLATLFYEPSTRTRLSFEAAMMNLGGTVLGFSSANSSSASKGESVADTIRVVSCFANICAMRHPKEGAPLVASMYSRIPVINAGDGGHQHPTQTLTDLLTIRSLKGRLNNLTIGFCGDLKFGRTVHSLIEALVRYTGIKIVLISPEELRLPDYIRDDVLRANNVPFEEVIKMEDVLPKLDVLYMTRVQKERFFNEDDYIRMKDFYILDQSKMDLASPEMLVLHPLPRVNEISVDVDNDPRAAYFKQVQYGVYARMALILTLLNIKVD